MKPDRCRKLLLGVFVLLVLTAAVCGCGRGKAEPSKETESEIETDEFDGHSDTTADSKGADRQDSTEGREGADRQDGTADREGADRQSSADWQEDPEGQADRSTRDRLAGGGTGQITYRVLYQDRTYQAEDGTDIFTLRLALPVLSGEAEGIPRINRFLEEWALKKLEEYEADENSTRQYALEVYRESRDRGWAGPWGEEYRVSLIKTHAGYVSILMDSYLNEGKTEGNPYRESLLFRLSDGQRVSLTEMTDREWTEWEQLLRERFSKLVGQDRRKTYYEDASERLKNRDMRDVGFYLIDTGIVFYLPPYEIAPYSSGYVEIVVPFDETGIKST